MQQSHVMFPSRQVIGGIYIRLRLRNFEINVFHHYISQWIHMGSKKDIPESKSQVRVQINLSTLNDSQKKHGLQNNRSFGSSPPPRPWFCRRPRGHGTRASHGLEHGGGVGVAAHGAECLGVDVLGRKGWGLGMGGDGWFIPISLV